MRLSPAGKFWLAYFLGLAIVVVVAVKSFAAQGSFSWLPNHEDDLAGYRIYHGSASGQYDGHVDVHLPPTGDDGRVHATIDIPDGLTYFAATAYDAEGNESEYSNEVVFDSPPAPPSGLQAVKVTVTVEVGQ